MKSPMNLKSGEMGSAEFRVESPDGLGKTRENTFASGVVLPDGVERGHPVGGICDDGRWRDGLWSGAGGYVHYVSGGFCIGEDIT